MSDPIVDALKAVGGPLKTLFVDKIQDYIKFIRTYDANMDALMEQLENLHATKVRIDTEVTEGEANLRVMTMETINWLERFLKLIKKEELKRLMKEERVAENVVRMMEHGVLKKLWNEDREIFDIVVRVVKKKCDRQPGDGEVLDAREDADYNKVAKIASDVMKDIAEDFNKFLKTDDAAVAVVKLLNDEDLEKLTKDGDEMAMLLGKAEGIVRNKIKNNDHGEEELLLPKHEKDVQLDSKSIITEKVGNWRKHMGSLMTFLDDEKFRKSLPDGANLGLEVMDVLSKSSGSELVEENGKSHRYCGWCVVRFESHRHHHDMSELAEIMIEAIKTLIDGYPVGRVTRRKRGDELENIPGDFKVGLESREELVQKILIALRDDQVNVVGVFGMGGGGKTTLAKEVVNKRVCDLFNKRVVVEVSEAPNIKGIQDQIAEGIGLSLEDVQSVAQRARNLYNSLKSEKILIVLDNVWKKLKLDEVGIPHESTGDFYCKLLITTREKQVCKDMDVKDDNIFEVGMLNEKEALKLFEKQTEKKVGNGEFKPVADRLLRKCGGLPLAIVTSGGALRGKKLPMWCHFAETSEKPISSQVSSEYHETYSVLETSYKLIDIEVKWTFFFLACLSPLDSAVAIDDLMRYGIGLDLFQRVNGLSEAMKQASAWANELVSSSLLLKSDSDRQVKIHDVVRASAISFADKGKDGMTLVESIPRWMCHETFEKFTAISLMSGNDFSRLSGVNAPLLKILLLKGDLSSPTLTPDFFGGMKNLKVLSLSNMNFNPGLPESMGELEHLKTLHLHYCKLRDVKLIGKLVNLLVLSFRGSTLEELASEIGELCKLRLLDIGGCKGMKRMPANILSRLSHLEGLYMLNGFDSWASTNIKVNDGGGFNQASANELDSLSHLNVLEMDVAKVEQLFSLNNIQLVEQLGKLKICVCNSDVSYEEAPVSPVCRYVLELSDIDASPSNWLRALLKRTECLVLSDCNWRTESAVSRLDEDGFKNLKYLTLSGINCEMICDGKAPTGTFSNLQSLTLRGLGNLKYGLPLTSVSLNLSEVSIEDCYALEFIVYKDTTIMKNETDVDMFPRLKSLHLSSVSSLSSMSGQSGNGIFSLFNTESKYASFETLKLSSNRTIVTLWSQAYCVSNFQNLKVLHIVSCTALVSLGSPSIFGALVQLEELKISECFELKEVISKETQGDRLHAQVINFPTLKNLSLDFLPKLERFYGGSYKLEFPNLKSLSLALVCVLTNFDGIENSSTFFSDKIKFPSLEKLDVERVPNEVTRLWNWPSLAVHGKSGNDSSSLNPVPNLQKLILGDLVQGLTSIPHYVSHKLSHIEVYGFKDIKSVFSVLVVNKEVLWTYSQLPKLENIAIGDSDSMEQLFDNEDDDVAVMFCGRLIAIMLDTMPKLKPLPLHLLKNIRTLDICKLSWKYVFSTDLFTKGREQLQQLESFSISECENVEVIINDELVGDGEERVYNFPRLKRLVLQMVSISKFASKQNIGLQFPLLESIHLIYSPNIQSFWSGPLTAPKLKEVHLYGNDNMECFMSEKGNQVRELPSLEKVKIKDCSKLLSFSSNPLVAPKLHHVFLKDCPTMKWFLPGDPNQDDILDLPSLESVSIEECSDMQSFSSGGIKAPNLCELKVDSNSYTKCANDELQAVLVELPKQHREENIYDQNCDDEEEIEELRVEGNDRTEAKQKTEEIKEVEELEELRTEGSN